MNRAEYRGGLRAALFSSLDTEGRAQVIDWVYQHGNRFETEIPTHGDVLVVYDADRIAGVFSMAPAAMVDSVVDVENPNFHQAFEFGRTRLEGILQAKGIREYLFTAAHGMPDSWVKRLAREASTVLPLLFRRTL